MLVILNKSDDTATMIDAQSGDVVETIPVGHCPHEAAATPDGRLVAVANYGDGDELGHSLSFIDARERRVTKTVDLVKYHRPHGMAFVDDGRHLIVTAEEEACLLIVDVEAGRVEAAIDTGAQISHMLALGPAGAMAYVANIGSGSITAIDLRRQEMVREIRTGEGAEGIAAHPTRWEVWVTNRVADTLSIVSTESLEVVQEIACPAFPIRAAFTPDGGTALVSCAKSGEVAVLDVGGREIVRRIGMDEEPVEGDELRKRLFSDRFGKSPVPIGILIEPDGTRAYVANSNADVVTILDLERWTVAGRLHAGREPDGLAWVPDPT